jgi:hypothetical protein
VNATEDKAEILKFINAYSGQYYAGGLQLNFTKFPASYLNMILKQLEVEKKITSNGGRTPYRVNFSC